MQPEVAITSWVLSDPPSHKVGCAQQQSFINGSDISVIRPKQVLGTSRLHEEVAQCLWLLVEAPLRTAWAWGLSCPGARSTPHPFVFSISSCPAIDTFWFCILWHCVFPEGTEN